MFVSTSCVNSVSITRQIPPKHIKQCTLGSIHPCQHRLGRPSVLLQYISEQVETLSSYISFCVHNITPSKTVTIFPNNKPWVTKERQEIRMFFTGSECEIKQVNKEVKRSRSRTSSMETSAQLDRTSEPSSVNTASSSPRAVRVEDSGPDELHSFTADSSQITPLSWR